MSAGGGRAMPLWLALLMAPSGYLAQLDIIPSPNKTIKLVEKIRRQLVEDNYDYQPSEDDAATTTGHHDPTTADDARQTMKGDTSTPDDARQTTNDGGLKLATDSPSVGDHRYNVSRKDLLYYMDFDGIRRSLDENEISASLSGEFDSGTASENITVPKVKYKVIKIKDTNPSRRKLSHQRYIQEESEAGVSIIRLDDAPFPLFHLPSGRRQYMEEEDVGRGDDNTTKTMDTS